MLASPPSCLYECAPLLSLPFFSPYGNSCQIRTPSALMHHSSTPPLLPDPSCTHLDVLHTRLIQNGSHVLTHEVHPQHCNSGAARLRHLDRCISHHQAVTDVYVRPRLRCSTQHTLDLWLLGRGVSRGGGGSTGANDTKTARVAGRVGRQPAVSTQLHKTFHKCDRMEG